MAKQKVPFDFTEELKFLFELMCKELEDYNLSRLELINLFYTLCLLIIYSANKKYKLNEKVQDEQVGDDEYVGLRLYSKRKIAKMIEENVKFDITKDIEHHFNSMKTSPFYKYKIPYFIRYFDNNNHLTNLLSNYSSKYSYPQTRYEVESFFAALRSSSTHKLLFPKGIEYRMKGSTSEGWSIKTYDGIIKIENAAYVWDEKEGAFRFVTQSGNWGFILQYSHEIIYLPKNIIQMEDFSCFRARVLLNDENNKEINGGFWNYIDMRGNIVSKDYYIKASDFEDNTAMVSKINLSWEMGMSHCVKNPDSNLQIDVFGNLTEESVMRRDEIIKEGEEKKRKVDWDRMIYDGGISDEDIIDAISNGNGDIFGY